jgi:hypothetical protein
MSLPTLRLYDLLRVDVLRSAMEVRKYLKSIEAIATPGLTIGQTLHVDAGAIADVSDGSLHKPFKTIQEAVSWIEDHSENLISYEIAVAAGDYSSENITLTRPRIHLRGSHAQYEQTMHCRIGKITIACAENMEGVYNTQFAISGFLVTSGNDCIVINGPIACAVYIKDVYMFSSGGRCLAVPQASARVKVTRCVLNNQGAAADTLESASAYLDLRDSNIYCGSTKAVEVTAGVLAMDSCLVEGVSGGSLITASGTSQVNASNCLIHPSAANSSGFVLSNTAQLTAIQNVFQVPAGTGFCIQGVLGNVVIHALNVFAPGFNAKYSSVIGAGLVPASTTPTLA